MDNVKSWLVANIETVASIVLVLIFIPFCISKCMESEWKSGEVTAMVFYTLLLAIAPQWVAIPKIWENVISLFALIGVTVYLYVGGKPLPVHEQIGVGTVWAVALTAGFFGARYAKTHFYDTVSRRMLYRSSKVDMFAAEWKYTINRFCVVTFCVLLIAFLCIFIYPANLFSK